MGLIDVWRLTKEFETPDDNRSLGTFRGVTKVFCFIVLTIKLWVISDIGDNLKLPFKHSFSQT